MHTLINQIHSFPPAAEANDGNFRQPRFEYREHRRKLDLVVFVPGVDADGLDLSLNDHELSLVARKHRFVRQNWQALRLEDAQSDYALTIHFDDTLNAGSVRADLNDGILTIHFPKSSHRGFGHVSVA